MVSAMTDPSWLILGMGILAISNAYAVTQISEARRKRRAGIALSVSLIIVIGASFSSQLN